MRGRLNDVTRKSYHKSISILLTEEDESAMMIPVVFSSISTLNLALILHVTSIVVTCRQLRDQFPVRYKIDRVSRGDIVPELTHFNLTHLLYRRFNHIFQDGEEQAKSEIQNKQNETDLNEQNKQSFLETRKIDHFLGLSGNQLQGDEFYARNYFKILNRVFSRVDLPELYKASRQRTGFCGSHIGCIEEIPNFPSLLKKPNVSSTFTLYTRDNAKIGHKIHFEPIIHHQLQDANASESEIHEKLQSNNVSNGGNNSGGNGNKLALGQQKRHQTATSWRTAAKIVRSQEYPFDLASLEQSGFNCSLNTRIIVGGYFAKEDEEWIDEVVRQWLTLEPSNVIKVSWADSNRGLYHTAAYNSRIVGRQLSLFLYYLDQMFHINLDRFHLVGHSLGAHIAGFVGSDNEGRIARITGLDPAGPIFVELNSSMRLDPSDAKFVDVVHTNGGTITKGALGLSVPSGHVDYYCNGGSVQPGCYFSSVTKSIIDPVERVACNHRRSYRYFIEIIKLAISEMSAQAVGTPTNQISTTNLNHQVSINGDSNCPNKIGCQNRPSKLSSQLPRAFLFEARQEDLVKLTQPEILVTSSNSLRRDSMTELAPLKRRLEFHLLNPEFPAGKRGMYFFRTRPESPFFGECRLANLLQ